MSRPPAANIILFAEPVASVAKTRFPVPPAATTVPVKLAGVDTADPVFA